MAAEIEYRSDAAGINKLANGPEVHELLMMRARLGARFAQANAPVETGRFRASIRVVDMGRGGPRRDRAAVRIEATSDDAVYVEFGTRKQAGHHVLRRAIDVVERG